MFSLEETSQRIGMPIMVIDATIVILTKNEERHIERAIESAAGFSEVLVIDSNSDDGTKEVARNAGARVLNFEWDGNYPKKKEWALSMVRTDWVFYLDADEYLDRGLVDEISTVVGNPAASAFEVPVRYFWQGKELRHGHRVSKRIGMRKSVSFWPRPDDLGVKNMWEVEGHYQPQITEGEVVRGRNFLGHQDEDGLFDYFARHNRYSDWEAHMLHLGETISARSRSRLGKLAVNLPVRHLVFFVYSYLLRLGFLDGKAGLNYALALSFYYWQIQVKLDELKDRERGQQL